MLDRYKESSETKETLMKRKGLGLVILSLTILAGCGKDNKSGQSGIYEYGNPYTSSVPTVLNSPYSSGGVLVNTVIAENPCVNQWGGYSMGGYAGNPYGGQRVMVQQPLPGFPTVIAPGDVYVGVTSVGDVGVIAGTGAGQPPVFVGYMCPRPFSQSGTGQISNIGIGAYTQCLVKPLWKATMYIPGDAPANFRMLDYGSSQGRKFSFCR